MEKLSDTMFDLKVPELEPMKYHNGNGRWPNLLPHLLLSLLVNYV